MGKKIIALSDGTDFMMDVDAIATMQIPAGSETLLALNFWNGNSNGNVQFLHESDPDHKVYNSFRDAIEYALSPKSNSEVLIRVNLPDGFTLTTDY